MPTTCPKCRTTFPGRSLGWHAPKCGLTAADLFFIKVNKVGPGGCWIFTGSIKPRNGYGHFRPNRRDYNAHRWSYEHHVGPIPEGMEVAHRCDVPACVNPEHLFLATHSENMADCKAKKRNTYGVKNKSAKLTEEKVRAIRREYIPGKRGNSLVGNIRELARRYGVGEATAYCAAVGKSWSHVK